MPLKKGKSIKTIASNIQELVSTKPKGARAKAVATIAKKRGVSKKEAQMIQAKAIAKKLAE